jgi:hypothetical protein
VGVSGLLTTKWVLQGHGDTASDYAQGRRHFVHQPLPIEDHSTESKKDGEDKAEAGKAEADSDANILQ